MAVTPPPPPPPHPEPRKEFPLIPVLAVLAVLSVAILIVVLLTRGGGGPGGNGTSSPPGSATQPTETTQPTEEPTEGPTEEPTDGPTGLPESLAWQALVQPDFGGAGDQVIAALSGHGGPEPTEGTPRFVAAGSDSSGGDPDAAVWVSEDGATWEAVHDDAFGGAGEQRIGGIHSSGKSLVAVGSDSSGGDSDAAVWTSQDGRGWSRVVDDSLGGAGNQTLFRVKGVRGLFIGAGSDTSGGDADAALWVSQDATDWDLLQDEAVFGGPGDQAIYRVQTWGTEVLGAPRFVAVGSDSAGGDEDGAVWVSEDGLAWQRVPDPDGVLGGPGDQRIVDVSSFGASMVAVGSDTAGGDEDGAVWTSDDGLRWERVDLPEEVSGGTGDQAILRVVSPEGGTGTFPAIVAGGLDASGGDDDAAIWLSEDGMVWVRDADPGGALGGPGDQRVLSLFLREAVVTAVGSDSAGGDADAAAWVARP